MLHFVNLFVIQGMEIFRCKTACMNRYNSSLFEITGSMAQINLWSMWVSTAFVASSARCLSPDLKVFHSGQKRVEKLSLKSGAQKAVAVELVFVFSGI